MRNRLREVRRKQAQNVRAGIFCKNEARRPHAVPPTS
jgi:hypothetical protein